MKHFQEGPSRVARLDRMKGGRVENHEMDPPSFILHGDTAAPSGTLINAKLASQRMCDCLLFVLCQFVNPALSNFDFATLTYRLILTASLDKGSLERKSSLC